jgi:NAD kinase
MLLQQQQLLGKGLPPPPYSHLPATAAHALAALPPAPTTAAVAAAAAACGISLPGSGSSKLRFAAAPSAVLVIKKANNPQVTADMRVLCDFLTDFFGITCYAEPIVVETEPLLAHLRPFDPRYPGRSIDFSVTLGGDGTVLHYNSLFKSSKPVPPVVSFALGSLGFLTPFPFAKYREVLATILESYSNPGSNVYVCTRLRLLCRVLKAPAPDRDPAAVAAATTGRGLTQGGGLSAQMLSARANANAAAAAASATAAASAAAAAAQGAPTVTFASTPMPTHSNNSSAAAGASAGAGAGIGDRATSLAAPVPPPAPSAPGSAGSPSPSPSPTETTPMPPVAPAPVLNRPAHSEAAAAASAPVTAASAAVGGDKSSRVFCYPDGCTGTAAGTVPDTEPETDTGANGAPSGVLPGNCNSQAVLNVSGANSSDASSHVTAATAAAVSGATAGAADGVGAPFSVTPASSGGFGSAAASVAPSAYSALAPRPTMPQEFSPLPPTSADAAAAAAAAATAAATVSAAVAAPAPAPTVVSVHQPLNEVVIQRGLLPSMALLELFIDGHFVTTVRADGLIVATPTGSTGYSMSAGGPMLAPSTPSITITPLCPHNLSFRPVVVCDSTIIRVRVPPGQSTSTPLFASFDGRNATELYPGDSIQISMSHIHVPSIVFTEFNYEWFKSIKHKLHWNKSFLDKKK